MSPTRTARVSAPARQEDAQELSLVVPELDPRLALEDAVPEEDLVEVEVLDDLPERSLEVVLDDPELELPRVSDVVIAVEAVQLRQVLGELARRVARLEALDGRVRDHEVLVLQEDEVTRLALGAEDHDLVESRPRAARRRS